MDSLDGAFVAAEHVAVLLKHRVGFEPADKEVAPRRRA